MVKSNACVQFRLFENGQWMSAKRESDAIPGEDHTCSRIVLCSRSPTVYFGPETSTAIGSPPVD